MRDLAFFGDRSGDFIAEIAAPGVDLNTTGRRLFSTETEMVQVLFTAEVAFSYSISQETVTSPFGTVTDYFLKGTATFLFPYVLTFQPQIFLTLFRRKDSTPAYIYTNTPYGPISSSYRSYTNKVDLIYSEALGSSTSTADALSARVNVLNLPWDKP